MNEQIIVSYRDVGGRCQIGDESSTEEETNNAELHWLLITCPVCVDFNIQVESRCCIKPGLLSVSSVLIVLSLIWHFTAFKPSYHSLRNDKNTKLYQFNICLFLNNVVRIRGVMRPGTSLGANILVPVSHVLTLEGNICKAHFCYIYYVKEKYRKFLWHRSDHLLFEYELDYDLSNLIWISLGHCPRHICVSSVRETFFSFCSRSIENKTYRPDFSFFFHHHLD